MRMLLLSFYYEPDLSAGSFRATALVRELLAQLPAGAQIDVVTTLPNRYQSFAVDAPEHEQHGPLTVRRIALAHHRSGMLDQSRAFLSFAWAVWRQVRTQRYDLVFATSSRLMTAALGAWVARRLRCPLYLDIRDIFVDTITEVLPRTPSRLLAPWLARLEGWTIRSATRVNLVSAGFLPYFQARYPQGRYSIHTNGIDDAFLQAQPAEVSESSGPVLTVLYAGNMGAGQGLHQIVPPLARRLSGRVRFVLIGDGGRRVQLQAALREGGVDNVELRAPVGRAELIAAYRAADILFVHLNDYEAFRKVLPSKIFEYAAMGKPLWAGVAGFAADFITAEITNAAVFPPCDADAALAAFAQLRMQTRPRTAFVARHTRSRIMQAMAADIWACVAQH
jgi:glycosyltransferase involved in cell wall biosynthesis